ncbi:class I SAM-dependent methyltransferase [Actinospica durhamensis]|uniref:Class I SAM-dependent methyltransferase n=1 Tax=Actinospica durhamensis TaxID=1508375 RepID=A0A941EQB7_9ACTN|nr:class I SAM-dependent methyltransferase [Actinospica durhamensis]MBR7835997.1 class I SAM-dependent methyltransferase [Actinospica durhamensis]
MDWNTWHDRYDNPDSPFVGRLETIRTCIRIALDEAPPGPLRAVSACAGRGLDLIPVLAEHPRGRDVRARLVELDPDNADHARELAAEAGLTDVEVVTGDAALTDHYIDLAPAHLVLLCGIFGNVVPADIERTARICSALCARGGTVIWTRGRKADPALFPHIERWFAREGFEEVFVTPEDIDLAVAAHRRTEEPTVLEPAQSMFEFIGYDVLYPRPA